MALNDTLDTLGVTGDWEFNETTGSSAAARVGSDALDIGAGVTLGATGGGNEGDTAFDFSGGSSTTDFVQEYAPTDGESYDADVKASRSLWIPLRCDDLTNDQQVIWQIGGRNGGVFIYITSSGDVYLNISNGSGLNYSGIFTGLTEAAWGSIGFVQRDSADEIDLYTNGSNVATIDISSVTSETMRSTLVIGSAQGNGSASNDRVRKHDNGVISLANSAFDGAIERVSYFSGVELTDTQMSDLHDEWLNGAGLAGTGAESVNVSDTSNSVLAALVTGSEDVSVSDSVSGTLSALAICQDSASVSDSSSCTVSSGNALTGTSSEDVNANDSTDAVLSALATGSDAVNADDSASGQLGALALCEDSVSASDAASCVVTQPGSVTGTGSEDIDVSDESSASIDALALSSDSIDATDAASCVVANPGDVVGTGTENIETSDESSATLALVATASDAVAVQESSLGVLSMSVAADDAVNVSDSASGVVSSPSDIAYMVGELTMVPAMRGELTMVPAMNGTLTLKPLN